MNNQTGMARRFAVSAALSLCLVGASHAETDFAETDRAAIDVYAKVGGSDINLGTTTYVGAAVTRVVSEPVRTSLLAKDPFSSLVGGKRSISKKRKNKGGSVDRYVVASDDKAFLFENLGSQARLRFLCGPDDVRVDCLIDTDVPAEEIHLLTPVSAGRGDTIYKDGRGETLLRIASYGGATVFWPGETQGQAASKSYGDGLSLSLAFADVDVVSRRLKAASALLSAKIGVPIVFEIDTLKEDEVAGAAVLADAISRAASGLDFVANDATGARVIGTRINKVAFIAQDKSSLNLREKTLIVGYNANRGLAGRPSSAKIVEFLEEEL